MLSSPTILVLLASAGILATALFLLRRNVTFKQSCPVCGDRYPDRVARTRWVKSIGLPLKAYRCLNCLHKFYQLETDHDHVHQ